jgi:hypothetical protein
MDLPKVVTVSGLLDMTPSLWVCLVSGPASTPDEKMHGCCYHNGVVNSHNSTVPRI